MRPKRFLLLPASPSFPRYTVDTDDSDFTCRSTANESNQAFKPFAMEKFSSAASHFSGFFYTLIRVNLCQIQFEKTHSCLYKVYLLKKHIRAQSQSLRSKEWSTNLLHLRFQEYTGHYISEMQDLWNNQDFSFDKGVQLTNKVWYHWFNALPLMMMSPPAPPFPPSGPPHSFQGSLWKVEAPSPPDPATTFTLR